MVNFSDQWTKSESEKNGLYGKIYDFVVDYKAIIVKNLQNKSTTCTDI